MSAQNELRTVRGRQVGVAQELSIESAPGQIRVIVPFIIQAITERSH